jgi:hypothetical protein
VVGGVSSLGGDAAVVDREPADEDVVDRLRPAGLPSRVARSDADGGKGIGEGRGERPQLRSVDRRIQVARRTRDRPASAASSTSASTWSARWRAAA